MGTLDRAVRNITTQLGSQAITWLATLIFTVAAGRYLGDVGLGVLFLGLSISGLFGVLVEFGLNPLITREVARQPDQAATYLVHGLFVKLILWLLAFAGLLLTARLLGYSALSREVITILAAQMGFMAAANTCWAVGCAQENLTPSALGVLAEKVGKSLIAVPLLLAGFGVIAVAWVILASAVANFAVQAALLRRRLAWRTVRLDLPFARTLFVGAIPFLGHAAIFTLYWRIDAVMLSKLESEAVVGWYGAAYRLFETLLFLPAIVAGSVMMPILARLSRESTRAMRVAFEKGLTLLLLVGLPIGGGLLVIARPVLSLVYGRPEFLQATGSLQVLALAVPVLYLNGALSWALVSLNRERRLVIYVAVVAVLNIALNLAFIPLWRHTGAAAATLLCELVLAGCFVATLPRWLISRACLVASGKALVATVAMVATLLPLAHAPLVVVIAVGAVVYALLIVILRTVPREDLVRLRGALRARAAPEPLEAA